MLPKKSVFSFYDLCYNIFKKDLDYGYTKDDEWICKVVAAQIRRVVSGGYCENKEVSIGSSVYSIKTGLKSFSQNGDVLKAVIERAINLLETCECSPSCYRCLRNYENQKVHEILDREIALNFLKQLV